MRHVALLISVGLSLACAESPPAAECLADTPTTATAPAPAASGESDLPLTEYFALHDLASRPKSPGWTEAIVQLAVRGDGFTLQHLRGLDRASLTAEQRQVLDGAVSALDSRTGGETAATLVPALRPRLERAAWADLRCTSVEGTIVPWTGASIVPFVGAPEVRAELTRLRDGYESTETSAGMKETMTKRVRGYAESLLSPNPRLEAKFR